MKLKNLIFGIGVAAMMLPTATMAKDITIVVNNNEPVQRQEVVEVSADAVYSQMGIRKGESIIVKNALGQEVT